MKEKYACCEKRNSKYDALAGKIFKVISFEPYTVSPVSEKFKLQIENAETGIIYFDYSPRFENSFPFKLIDGLDFPEGYFCKDIEESKDKFSDEITFRTPIIEGISFLKIKTTDLVSTYLRIRIHGRTLNVNTTGVIILFDNGSKLEIPDAEIEVDVSSGSIDGYTYSAFISLSEDEIKLLSENIMTDVRLYIYDGIVKNGNKLADYMKCISSK